MTPDRPPKRYPPPEESDRVSCLVQGAVVTALLVVFVVFVRWLVLTRS